MSFPGIFIDQLGREVKLHAPPQRVISLCPSLTETLVDLGLGPRLVGRTRFCIHPIDVMREIPNVGGTKDVSFDRIRALKPDLIIGEKEENTAAMIEALAAEYPVYMTDVVDLASAHEMVLQLGAITDTQTQAAELAERIAHSWAKVTPLPAAMPCLYFIWKSPWMVVGADTYIDSVLKKCGFDNLATAWEGRYPVLDENNFFPKTPLVVLLSTEPYPFKESQIAEIEAFIPGAVVRIVDGEMFSWYGSHMVGVENYLNLLLKDVASSLSLHL